MERFLPLFAQLLFISFIGCCVASALLQIVAWTRHAKEGAQVSPGALWKPEGHFDDVGLFQMRLAKRALIIGGVAYLSYGVLMLVASTLLRQG
ncbi:MAG TPA: hypothetical protein VFR81_04160 [Longimicrobium sp.]|nr:hypothetical protein [Longimicrobium sp.]